MTTAEREQRKVLTAIVIGLLLAAIAAVAGISNGLQVRAASTADVQRNARLIVQVRTLEEAGNRDVAEHRHANQADHDCIVGLALLLADPKRDRMAPIVPPAPCRRSPAAGNQ